MENAKIWNRFFREWPADLPQRGVVTTSFGEQVPFCGYLLADDLVLFERNAPDTLGARKLIVPFSAIEAIKIVDPIKGTAFEATGFKGSLPEK